MKLRQLFCAHKQKHLAHYEYLQGFLNCPINEIYEVYECDKCGKQFIKKYSKSEEWDEKSNRRF